MSLPPLPAPPDMERQESGDAEYQQGSRSGSKAPTKAETLDTRPTDILGLTLKKMTYTKLPEIHPYPAPPAIPPQGDPALFHHRPPVLHHVGDRQTYLQRFMNSSTGRFLVFASTIFFVNISILGLVSYDKPEHREAGLAFYYFFMALFVLLVNYTIPLVAERSGMTAKETGWKPFYILYRLSFLMAIPAAVCQMLGTGAENAFGKPAGPAGVLELKNLQNNYWDYFELADGFVAFNLTKGVTETLAAEEHGVEGHRRFSRFRDAELRVNTEPYSDQPEPTETPGRLFTYRIAPIFAEWHPCVTRYRISTICLRDNPVMAWAIASSTSLCSRYKSVACRPPKPLLEPVYQCSQVDPVTGEYGVKGIGRKMPIQGVCGHVAKAPPAGAIDELSALLLYDAFPKFSLPSADSLWLDVSPDECVSDPAKCKEQWDQYFLAGLIFQILANLCIVVPMIYDCRFDRKIRQARQFVEEEEHKKKQKALAAKNLTQAK